MPALFNPLNNCLLYKGQSDCPQDIIQQEYGYLFWSGEKLYCDTVFDDKQAKEIEDFYHNCGLDGADYTTSLLLKACIFSMLCKNSDNSPAGDALFFYDVVLPKYLALHKHI
ncbi:MAG: hypothetical protein MJ002_01500 [Paludibacteraceae bacterium]|nr:hypothetical protein [Paludibacteraceae bacterium]